MMSEKISKDEKKSFKLKLLEIKKQGLLSYRAYLEEQELHAKKSEIRKSYLKYIESQLIMNQKKIDKIDSKLKTNEGK